MNENKRRFTRVPFRVRTVIEIEKNSYIIDALYNLSIGGCLFSADVSPKMGTPCLVTILLNETDEAFSVRVSGEIVRTEAGMIAVRFTKIDPDSLFHLRNIIRYNAPDSEEVEHEIEQHPGLI